MEAHITTWAVEGPDLYGLAARLRGLPGVKQLVPFGNILHVSGSDAELLQQSIAPFIQDIEYRWTRSEPGLEDVFIQLMDEDKDSFA